MPGGHWFGKVDQQVYEFVHAWAGFVHNISLQLCGRHNTSFEVITQVVDFFLELLLTFECNSLEETLAYILKSSTLSRPPSPHNPRFERC